MDIVANLNIDGATPFYEVHDIVALGAEHSTLAAHVAEAARVAGLAISPDPDPAQVAFIRSDQYSFVKQGVPSIFAGAGWRDASGAIEANKALSDAWGAQHYHRPSDEWRDEYRVEWAMPEIRFHFLVGLSVATAPERPRWNDGDAFGAFAKKR
jgi:Zn-dependent M28 family amino/carboxypeptidase